MSAPDRTLATSGVSVEIIPDPATTVADVSTPEAAVKSGGLSVGLMVTLLFAVTILTAIGDTAINGSLTFITGAVFVVISVIGAATVSYGDLSTSIITPPLAYFTAIVLAGQGQILSGVRDNMLIREVAMVMGGLAYNAPWIFAGTGAAALIVAVRRFLLHR